MPSPIKNILITKWLIICIWCPCPIYLLIWRKILCYHFTTRTHFPHIQFVAIIWCQHWHRWKTSILERMQFSSFELRLERLTKNHSSITNSLFGLHFTASTGVFLEKALYMLCALCMLWLVHICRSIHTSHMCEASNYKNQNGKFWTGAG